MSKRTLINIPNTFFRALLCSVFVFGFVLICFVALNPVAPARAQESRVRKIEGAQDKSIDQISLLIEEGFTTPPLLLLNLTDESALEVSEKRAILGKHSELRDLVAQNTTPELEIVFKIEGKSAHFEQTGSGLIQSGVNNGVVMLPAIRAERADEGQAIQVLVDGKEMVEKLSVVVLPKGTIKALQQFKADNEAAFLTFADHHAVIDTGRITNTNIAAVPVYLSLNGELSPSEEEVDQLKRLARTPILNSFSDRNIGGLVYWQMNDPKGAGFSYLPEHDNKLWWATPFANIVDGVYRKSWGCNVAVKVPSYCTAYVYNDRITGLCNPLYVIAGTIRWVYPPKVGNGSWPPCPLGR